MKFLRMLFTLIFVMILCTSSVYANAPVLIYKHPLRIQVVIICFFISFVAFNWCINNVIKIISEKEKKQGRIWITILNVIWALANAVALIIFVTKENFEELAKSTLWVTPINFLIMMFNFARKIIKNRQNKKTRYISIILLIIVSVLFFCYIDTVILYKIGLSIFQEYYEVGPGISQSLQGGLR